jgi:hypothetical protein
MVSRYVDADHAGCCDARREVNGAPILHRLKKTVETTTFGREFVALTTAVAFIVIFKLISY